MTFSTNALKDVSERDEILARICSGHGVELPSRHKIKWLSENIGASVLVYLAATEMVSDDRRDYWKALSVPDRRVDVHAMTFEEDLSLCYWATFLLGWKAGDSPFAYFGDPFKPILCVIDANNFGQIRKKPLGIIKPLPKGVVKINAVMDLHSRISTMGVFWRAMAMETLLRHEGVSETVYVKDGNFYFANSDDYAVMMTKYGDLLT